MPTYEYECKSCGYTFDAFQSMSDEPLKACPRCGRDVRRLINGGTGVIFRGSGFYVTDKKGGKSSPPPNSSKTPDKDGAAKTPDLPAGSAAKTENASPGTAGGAEKKAAV
jgi:putative FmdB family regulatory protein